MQLQCPCKCMLLLILSLTAAVFYMGFILMTYDRSIDGAQLDIGINDREKEVLNTKQPFLTTDQRSIYRKESKEDWLQENHHHVINLRNGENEPAPQLGDRGSFRPETNEDQDKIKGNGKEIPDQSPVANNEKFRVETTGNTNGNDSEPIEKKNNGFASTRPIPQDNIYLESSSTNFTLKFTSNFDFGSGLYKAFWVQAEGTFIQRVSAFNKAIVELRNKIVKERGKAPYRPLSGSMESLWCNRDDFHKELENYPHVKTVALAWKVPVRRDKVITWDSQNDTSNLILQNYYPWTGSNSLCNWINTAGFTRARWDAVYHKKCKTMENATKDIQMESLEPVYLHGKPINKQHYWPNHGLNYPPYFYTTTPPQSLYMHILEDAVVTSLGDVISGNLKLIPYSCSQDLVAAPPPDYKTSPIHDEVFIMGQYWGASFFHLMLENLPRVAPYLPFFQSNPDILIHAQSREGHTAKLLEVLTLNSSRLIQGTVRARRVYLPQATPCGFAQIQSTQLLARLYFSHINSLYNPSQRRSILLIRRSGNRKFTQHLKIKTALESIAREFNLEFQMFIDNPSPPMQEAMVMFRRAVLVVGPHGAGLSNIVYCEAGTLVIEGVCNPPHVNMCYQWSAHVLGHRYHGIASRGGCETWVDVDHRELIDAARKMLKQKLNAL